MYYISVNNSQQGPFDEAGISQLLASGEANAQSLVWAEGMAAWAPLRSTELARLLPQGPSPASTPAYNPYQPPAMNPRGPGAYVENAAPLTWSQILWSFEGRIPRRQYWAGLGIWFGIFLLVLTVTGSLSSEEESPVAGMFILLLLIPYIWSAFALAIKRWHDRGKSGVMVLVAFIPFIGGIWTFVECGCMRGTEGRNQYGPDPT